MPRVTGMLHDLHDVPVVASNAALRDFIHERWKGLVPAMWGDQLRQARLDDLIFGSLLSVGELSGPSSTPLGPVMYEPATDDTTVTARTRRTDASSFGPTVAAPRRDVVVVGGGLAGLTAAWRAASSGASVTLLTKGWGSLLWHAGTVDVIGYHDRERSEIVTRPRDALEQLISANAEHPYALASIGVLEEAIGALTDLCNDAGYPLLGGLDSNYLIATGLGAARPTCLVPSTMTAGDLRRTDSTLAVGFDRFLDFFPGLVADNLATRGIEAHGLTLHLDTLQRRRFVYATNLADLFETDEFREEVANAILAQGVTAARIGFPAVLGHQSAHRVVGDLSDRLGAEVFEIPTLPPSVPGMRLQRILRKAIVASGGKVVDNAEVISLERTTSGLEITTLAAARRQRHLAQRAILATGGLLGGGIVGEPDGTLTETVAGLEVVGPSVRSDWFERDLVNGSGHPVYRAGVKVNSDLSAPGFDDALAIAGNMIAGVDPLRQGSLEGIALATGWAAGRGLATRP